MDWHHFEKFLYLIIILEEKMLLSVGCEEQTLYQWLFGTVRNSYYKLQINNTAYLSYFLLRVLALTSR